MQEMIADVLTIILTNTPERTGDLKRSFKIDINDDGFTIYTEIPYMQYTNEIWEYNKRWGKVLQNPNLHWFDLTILEIAEMLALRGGGYVVIK